MSNSKRAVIIIIIILLLVSFYESKRIGIFCFGDESFLCSFGTGFSLVSENVKSSLGLAGFFNNEEAFWTNLKKSPKIFTFYQENSPINTPIPTLNPTPTPLPQKLKPPYKIIIVGDSFIAERFGVQLEKKFLQYKETEVFRKGIYSTGLSRPDYFNWNDQIKKLITANQPNVAIVMFGANDGQDQKTVDGKVIYYSTKEWNEEYTKRVASFLDILSENKIFVFWLGNPMARDDYYRKKMENLNSAYEAECKKLNNCFYIPTWDILKDSNGKYSAYLPDENGKLQLARTSDGIHVTIFGANILVEGVIEKIKTKMELAQLSD